jgi:phage/conjugal plasmid C-4 type zinc finger TraR family protein
MADAIDLAQQREQEDRERHIKNALIRRASVSAFECEACSSPIPEARRLAVPGVELCVSCQEIVELKNQHYKHAI